MRRRRFIERVLGWVGLSVSVPFVQPLSAQPRHPVARSDADFLEIIRPSVQGRWLSASPGVHEGEHVWVGQTLVEPCNPLVHAPNGIVLSREGDRAYVIVLPDASDHPSQRTRPFDNLASLQAARSGPSQKQSVDPFEW